MSQLVFVVNIFDPLNFDMAFDGDIHPKYEQAISQAYTYFQSDNLLDPMLTAYRSHSMVPYYDDYQPDFNDNAILTGRSYRCHMKDLKFRSNAKFHPDYYLAKRILTQWIDLHNGWVHCKLYNVDIYKRLIVDLFDIETGESFKEYLVEQFPTVFCHSREQSTTVHLSQRSATHVVQRPIIFSSIPSLVARPVTSWE